MIAAGGQNFLDTTHMLVAHNHVQFQLQRNLTSLASPGTSIHVHVPIATHIYIIENNRDKHFERQFSDPYAAQMK